MAPAVPHQGGSLSDMAPAGTGIPGDAGKMNIIPSVARPDQAEPPLESSHANPAHAADNQFDIPRGAADRGQTAEVITGTGNQLPASIEKKNLDDAGYDPRAKGHDRSAKHAKQRDGLSYMAEEGPDVQPASGEEDEEQAVLSERRNA